MLQLEHSAILSTFIRLPSVIKIFVLSIFEWLFYTSFTVWSRGQTDIWAILRVCCTPQEEKLGYYFQFGTCLGALKTHVLLSFLWSAFCKWPVINVTLLTLKIVVLNIQD